MQNKCLLSIMDNERGNQIAKEMVSFLATKYEIIEFRHDGTKYEYPGILMAAKLSKEYNEKILYIHTKGAGNPNSAQPWVRMFWYYFLAQHNEWLNEHNDGIQCILLGKEKQTWFNAFMINPDAAEIIINNMEETNDRYYYEQLPEKIKINNVYALAYDVKPEEIGKVVKELEKKIK